MRAVALVLIYSLLQTVAGQFWGNSNKSPLYTKKDIVSFVGEESYIHLCNVTINESTKLHAPFLLIKNNNDGFNLRNSIDLFNNAKSGNIYSKFASTGLYTSIARDLGTEFYSYDYKIDEVQENDAGLYICSYSLDIYNENILIKQIHHLHLVKLIVKHPFLRGIWEY